MFHNFSDQKAQFEVLESQARKFIKEEAWVNITITITITITAIGRALRWPSPLSSFSFVAYNLFLALSLLYSVSCIVDYLICPIRWRRSMCLTPFSTGT